MGSMKSKQAMSQEDLEFLKTHTQYDEGTIKEYFEVFMRDCPDGHLTPAKFADLHKTEQFSEHVFRGAIQ